MMPWVVSKNLGRSHTLLQVTQWNTTGATNSFNSMGHNLHMFSQHIPCTPRMKSITLLALVDAFTVTMDSELTRGVTTTNVALSQRCSAIPRLTIQVKQFRSIV